MKKQLRLRKEQLAKLETLREAKTAMKRYAPAMLGAGKANGNGARGRKMRWECMDRVLGAGVGLSSSQRNDWSWFKEQWDAKMVHDYGKEWGDTFASWMNKILEDTEGGTTNAFSLFVFNETKRNFPDVKGVAAPGHKK